jgi:ribosomal protein S18 acetylase RimI-like enzyme
MPTVVEIDPAPGDVLFIERGLFGFEEARLGNPIHTHFGIFVRDGDGRVQGGVDCHVMWRRVFVKTLWLPDRLRNQGHGTRLMTGVETEGRRLKCRSVWLTALGDRAYRFYYGIGYRKFGEHEDYVAGQTLYSLRKDLPEV